MFPGALDAASTPTPGVNIPAAQSSDHFADVLADAGDVNGDGYSDVLIGAPYFDDGQPGAGKVYLYNGSASGPSTTVAWSKSGEKTDVHFGSAVASAGDVNNDGYADVIIGAPDFSNGHTAEGLAFVFHGSSTGLGDRAAWTTEPDVAQTRHGAAVASAGDVNGDGFGDVVVGGPGYSHGQLSEGSIRVYHGGLDGLSKTPARTIEGGVDGAHLGVAVAAGDANGDGYADVVAGADGLSNPQSGEGRVSVFHGSITGIPATATWSFESDRESSGLGSSLALVDVNADGNDDLLVGAPLFESAVNGNQVENSGRVYLFLGSLTGFSSASWFRGGTQEYDQLGHQVSSAGDLNGDGYGDFLISVPDDQSVNYPSATYQRGRVEVFYGSEAGPSTEPTWTLQGTVQEAHFGASLAGGGDFNGDGFSDFVVGSSSSVVEFGAAQVFLGGSQSFSNKTMLPRLVRAGTSTPLLKWNKAPSKAFDMKVNNVRLLTGAGRGKLWIDARTAGTKFAGGASASAWVSVGTGGTNLLGSRTGLTAAKSYHVRARVVGDPAAGGVPSATRWIYGALGAAQGTHLRTP